MKAIRTRIQKSSRPLVILLATVVAIITSIVVANATQTITTPNAAFISYNLAAGGNSAEITPAGNRSVLVMGCSTTTSPSNDTGVGQVSLFRLPASYLQWVGLESPSAADNASITSGFSATLGTHIVYIDFAHTVDIQIFSFDTIRVHNGAASTRTGNVTLVW
jgi:hypothetical protein